MISLQNETIQAVLFHDRTSDAACAALKVFLQRILQRFAEVFEHELEQLQPRLQASATPTAEEVRRSFWSFTTFTSCNVPKVLTNWSCHNVLFAARGCGSSVPEIRSGAQQSIATANQWRRRAGVSVFTTIFFTRIRYLGNQTAPQHRAELKRQSDDSGIVAFTTCM